MLKNQNDKGSLQKTHLRSSTSSSKVWWLENGCSQGLNEDGESRNNHQYAVVVQDLATQCIQYCPCKTKTSQEIEKSLKKVLGADVETESQLYRQFIGVWPISWTSVMESLYINTSPILGGWYCWKRRKTSERRNFSSIATIRIGWKRMGWLYGMLWLSSKCPRPPVRRENSL